ncbi:MAG: hypothetical protein CSA52_03410 [Gammaproteobacteria bacterium]|nr:MAG: hypothetical protein CSB48_04140 [Pseudomonadota bacterium]PIE38241.1 MAG: hypothetical protein CSA52_03410 [Gammaproteobacteria bacterium]
MQNNEMRHSVKTLLQSEWQEHHLRLSLFKKNKFAKIIFRLQKRAQVNSHQLTKESLVSSYPVPGV